MEEQVKVSKATKASEAVKAGEAVKVIKLDEFSEGNIIHDADNLKGSETRRMRLELIPFMMNGVPSQDNKLFFGQVFPVNVIHGIENIPPGISAHIIDLPDQVPDRFTFGGAVVRAGFFLFSERTQGGIFAQFLFGDVEQGTDEADAAVEHRERLGQGTDGAMIDHVQQNGLYGIVPVMPERNLVAVQFPGHLEDPLAPVP
jgi:hypothetical protein